MAISRRLMVMLAASTAMVFGALPAAIAQSMDQTGGTTRFVRLAALGNHVEIEAGQLALQRSSNPAVRGFAEAMIKDHAQAQNDLKFTNNSSANASMPGQLDTEHQAIINELRAAAPDRFDFVYMSGQVEAHRKALDMYQEYARVGSVDSLKKLAVKTAPIIEQHLRHAQTVLGDVQR